LRKIVPMESLSGDESEIASNTWQSKRPFRVVRVVGSFIKCVHHA